MGSLRARFVRVEEFLRERLGRLTDPLFLFPLLAVILLGVLWASTSSLIGALRTNAERAASALTAELLETYEAQVVRALREIDQTLKLLQLEFDRRQGSISLADLDARGLLPPSLIFTVTIVDRDGAVVDSTGPAADGTLAGSDDLLAAQESDGLAVALPATDPQTGAWSLRFSRPLPDGAGGFAGAASIVVDSAYFVSGYEPSKLGENGVLGVLGTDGIFRARRTGETVSAGEEAGDVAALGDEGSVAAIRNAWDGEIRFTSARVLYAFPLAVVVGVAVDEALAPAVREARVYRQRAAATSLLLVGLLAVLGRMSWQIQRIRRREYLTKVAHTEQVQYLADHDGLTGLPNRSLFGRLLEQAIREAVRYKRELAVLFIDLDRFKQINDTLGHDAGDELLREVASRLKQSLRESDSVARLGGDEFMVLLPQIAAPHAAARVAEKILAQLALPFSVLGHEFRVTGSIGISVFPADGLDEQTLTKNADIAMYQAKGEGKNNFQFYSEEISSQSLERLALESCLRHALETDEFQLSYQAKRDALSDRITGVEALLRWEHPELATVAPMRFLSVAEETGLIVPIGRWVLNAACHQSMAWQREGLPPLRVSVNLSSRQLFDEGLVRDVREALESSGMAADLLELEIREGLVMHGVPGTRRILQGLKELGVRIAIDEFGVGYSELNSLERYPLDSIKIDRSFIHHVSDASARLTDAVVALGRSLSVTIVGQGVETDEQAAFLRHHGCDELQGFHVHRPMPPHELAELLRRGGGSTTRAAVSERTDED